MSSSRSAAPSTARLRVAEWLARLDAARATLRIEVEPDIVEARGRSPEEQDAALCATSRSTWEVLRTRPDLDRLLELREPPAPDFPALWARLRGRREEERRRGTDDHRSNSEADAGAIGCRREAAHRF